MRAMRALAHPGNNGVTTIRIAAEPNTCGVTATALMLVRRHIISVPLSGGRSTAARPGLCSVCTPALTPCVEATSAFASC